MICKARLCFLCAVAALVMGCNRETAAVIDEDADEGVAEALFLPVQTALPLHTTREQDAKAAELFMRTKDEKTYDAKKALLEEALALDGISDAVRTMLQKELDSLVPPPPPVAAKPKSAFQSVSMPKQLPKSKSRYSVNMGEMMKTITDAGVTEDPFK